MYRTTFFVREFIAVFIFNSTQDNVGTEWLFAQQRQSQVIEPEQSVDRDFLGLLERRNGRLQGRQRDQGQRGRGREGEHEAALHGDRL